MASPPASRRACAPAELPLLPDEILEKIFLLLDSGYDLARASATCRTFRRVAIGRPFLRRFLSLHPPPIVGFIDFAKNRGLYLAEPPHRSASASRAVAQYGDFTFSFLPGASDPNNSWCVCDVRDRRFLLSRKSSDASTFLELVVCDPLYRRYVQIPPIPGDLVPRTPPSDKMKSEPFLTPADEDDSEEHSHFRVIYNWLSNYKLVSFVFSAATGKWCCATSLSFLPARLILRPQNLERYYACSCFYWVCRSEKYMLVLHDLCEMKFSLVLNDNVGHSLASLAFMDAAEDRLGLLILDRHTLYLYTKTRQNNGVGAEEWRHDKFIPLPKSYYNYYIIGAAEGYLLLGGYLCNEGDYEWMRERNCCFVVNLEKLLVERLCVLDNDFLQVHGHPYASLPPPLSLPSL